MNIHLNLSFNSTLHEPFIEKEKKELIEIIQLDFYLKTKNFIPSEKFNILSIEYNSNNKDNEKKNRAKN